MYTLIVSLEMIMPRKAAIFPPHINSGSDAHSRSDCASPLCNLLASLGWRLVKTRWNHGTHSGETGILHLLAFEESADELVPGIRRPWFVLCISEAPLAKRDIADYINASWNMDLPVLVIQESQSVQVYICVGRCCNQDPSPDISLHVSGDTGFSKTLADLFSLHETERTGFFRYIARRHASREEGGIRSVEQSLFRTLESWRDHLARKIRLSSPLVSAGDLDSCVIKVVLQLFWDKTVHETDGEGIMLDHALPAWFTLSEETPRFSPPDFCLLKRELVAKGLLDTEFFLSLIPIPRIVSAFHGLLKERSRADMAGLSLPPDSVVDYCLGQVAGWKGSRPDEHGAILDPACGCGLFLSRLPPILLSCPVPGESGESERSGGTPVSSELIIPCRPDLALADRNLSGNEALDIAGILKGADPDPVAVDVCRCMLALVLREITQKADWTKISGDLAKTLQNNIVTGDVLIGDDFGRVVGWKFPRQSPPGLKDNPVMRGFPDNMACMRDVNVITGFFNVSGSRIPGEDRHYLHTRYDTFHRKACPASCLIERSFELLSPGGALIAVLPGEWLRSDSFRSTRSLLSKNRIHSIIGISFRLEKPNRNPQYSIIAASPMPPGRETRIARVLASPYESLDQSIHSGTFTLPQDKLGPGGWSLIDMRIARLERKIRGGRPSLDEYVMGRIFSGELTDEHYDALLSRGDVGILQMRHPRETILLHPFVSGESISRYGTLTADRFLPAKPVPGSSDQETGLDYNPVHGPKLFVSARQRGISCTIDEGGFLAGPRVIVIPGDDLFLLAVLNSRILSFYLNRLRSHHPDRDILSLIRALPVHVVDLGDRDEHTLYDRIVADVRQLLFLNGALGHDHERVGEIRAQAQEIDQEIDTIVSRLYGLSDEEIQAMKRSSTVFPR
jgi:hypothetical protein